MTDQQTRTDDDTNRHDVAEQLHAVILKYLDAFDTQEKFDAADPETRRAFYNAWDSWRTLISKPQSHREVRGTKRDVPASKAHPDSGVRLLCAGPRSHSDTTRDCRHWVAFRVHDRPGMIDPGLILNRWSVGSHSGTVTNAQGETLDYEARSVCRKCGTVTYFDRAANVIHSHG